MEFPAFSFFEGLTGETAAKFQGLFGLAACP
jgi:hypothetical protein